VVVVREGPRRAQRKHICRRAWCGDRTERRRVGGARGARQSGRREASARDGRERAVGGRRGAARVGGARGMVRQPARLREKRAHARRGAAEDKGGGGGVGNKSQAANAGSEKPLTTCAAR
jgi:hypothetical protein